MPPSVVRSSTPTRLDTRSRPCYNKSMSNPTKSDPYWIIPIALAVALGIPAIAMSVAMILATR